MQSLIVFKYNILKVFPQTLFKVLFVQLFYRKFQNHFSTRICPSEIYRTIFPIRFVPQKFSEAFFFVSLAFRKFLKLQVTFFSSKQFN
jgi:hypothetical protein